MEVLGFTTDKNLVQLQLTVDEVVDNLIDPWQVDLFAHDPVLLGGAPDLKPVDDLIDDFIDNVIDPSEVKVFVPIPAKSKVQERKLYFTPLKDLSFAYEDGDKGVIGVFQNGRGLCVLGEIVRDARPESNDVDFSRLSLNGTLTESEESLRLRNIKIEANDFNRHWREYLRRIFQSREPLVAWKPKRSAQVVLASGSVEFKSLRAADARNLAFLLRCSYAAETLESLSIDGIAWPTQLTWLFDTFTGYRPVVFGKAVWQALVGSPVNEVDLMFQSLDRPLSVSGIAQKIRALGVKGNVFVHDGTTYRFHPWQEAGAEQLSVAGVRLDEKMALSGSRLDLYDLSQTQARASSARMVLLDESNLCVSLATPTELPGLHILPERLGEGYVDNDCHVQPGTTHYAEMLRRVGPSIVGKELSPDDISSYMKKIAESAREDFRRGRRSVACLTARDVRDFILQNASARGVTAAHRDRFSLAAVEQSRRSFMKRIFGYALVEDFASICEEQLRQYLEYVQALYAGNFRERSEATIETFLREIESRPALALTPGSEKSFRTHILMSRFAATHGGVRSLQTIDARLTQAVEQNIVWHATRAIYLRDTAKAHEEMVLRLIHRFGFCEHCAQQLMKELEETRDFLQ